MKKLSTYVSSINIRINSNYSEHSLGVPSDESIKKFEDWLYSYDFGDFKITSFEVVVFDVFEIKVMNVFHDYSKINDIISIINKAAKKYLKK